MNIIKRYDLRKLAPSPSEVHITENGVMYIGSTGAPTGTYVDDNRYVIVPTGGNGSAAWIVAPAMPVDWVQATNPSPTTRWRRPIEFYDDFLGDVLQDPWHTLAGTDATAAAILSNGTAGYARLTFGANASADMAANGVTLDAMRNWRPLQGPLAIEVRLLVSAITSVALFVGFTDQTPLLEMPFTLGAENALTSNATDACGFLFDTAADTDNIWLVGVANDVDAAHVDSGQALVAGTARVLRIEVDTSGTATFRINGVIVGTVTGVVTPSVNLTPCVAGFSRTNAARTVDVDYISIDGVRT